MKVIEDMLSPYAKKPLEDLDLKETSTEKLIPNLNSKKKYLSACGFSCQLPGF
jgi:hypothetical protein